MKQEVEKPTETWAEYYERLGKECKYSLQDGRVIFCVRHKSDVLCIRLEGLDCKERRLR
jgi:hypothetical protein